MKCINCDAEVETDDNFCWKCGHWTGKGYNFLKNEDNVKMIQNGDALKQRERFTILLVLFFLGILLFTGMTLIKGNDLFRPIAYLKKQINSYIYGYNSSIIKTDNKYHKETINSYEDALEFIEKDFKEQTFMCYKDLEITKIEYSLMENYSIPSVVFCDISLKEAQKLRDVIVKMYDLFPNIKGALTNITITNAKSKDEYIAFFQPMYQFVNIEDDIKEYNKVNKTQILLNSYYFLNEDILNKPLSSVLPENWYVKDATFESTLAHELGHYITFVIFLKEHNLNNITFVNQDNYDLINKLMEEYDKRLFAEDILKEALNNYNQNYNANLDLGSFSSLISTYASSKDQNGNLIFDETIAEAIHDYYLHGDLLNNSSKEIIKIIKRRLG